MNPFRHLGLPHEWRPLVQAAADARWTLEKTGSGHIRWQSPEGTCTFTSSSPSDRRAMYNARSRLRRAGLPI